MFGGALKGAARSRASNGAGRGGTAGCRGAGGAGVIFICVLTRHLSVRSRISALGPRLPAGGPDLTAVVRPEPAAPPPYVPDVGRGAAFHSHQARRARRQHGGEWGGVPHGSVSQSARLWGLRGADLVTRQRGARGSGTTEQCLRKSRAARRRSAVP